MGPCFMKTRGRKKIPEFYVEVYGVVVYSRQYNHRIK